MSGVNKAIIVGNLGADPEVRYTANGTAVATLSIATSERWTDKESGERKEETEWHRVVLWRRLAEIAGEYLKKGSKVYVEGPLKTRKWEDQNGVDRYTTEIVGRQLQMLDSRGGNAQSDAPQSNNQSGGFRDKPGNEGDTPPDFEDDDIPF